MPGFTPISALLGGVLIGLAASLFMLAHGRVAGVTGIFGSLLERGTPGKSVSAFFVGGLLLAGVLARLVHPAALAPQTSNLALMGLAGLLVGAGTQVGAGCTSGHGVCGLSRLSRRSLVATLTFIATGILTVAVVRALGGLS